MIGEEINGQYRLIELLGEGGMGVVYMALDLELERRVALKFLKADLADNAVLRQRFRDELRTLAGFNHPNITTLFTSVTWQGRPVMVMELVEGETLQKMVDRRGPIPAEVSVPLIQQALAGVGSAHRKKIVHRDLKPANLMLNTDGVVKVMDFGIAKIQNSPGLTRTNTAVGTSLYMAPEQIRGAGADARTDIYAMGVTLYELLAGRVPFLGESQYEIENAHVQQIPDLPTLYYPHIPSQVVDAVMRALAKDPAGRFQTAEEFAAVLGAPARPAAMVVESHVAAPSEPATPVAAVVVPGAARSTQPETASSPPETASVPSVPPAKRKVAIIAGVGAAAVLIAAAGLWMHSSPSPPPDTPTVDIPRTPPSTTTPDVASPGPSAASTPQPTGPPPAASTPQAETPPHPAPAKPAAQLASGLAGEWAGKYEDNCNSDKRTQVVMALAEPVAGRITGALRLSTAEGATGQCSLSGVRMQAGKIILKAGQCRGAVPPYFLGNHESLLGGAGASMSGTVEPEDSSCVSIELTRK